MAALHTYLPQDRLRALSRGEALPDRTTGSALFADISGFTELTESLRESLEYYEKILEKLIQVRLFQRDVGVKNIVALVMRPLRTLYLFMPELVGRITY